MIPEPSINELLKAGGVSVQTLGDRNVDLVTGSDYDSLLGPCAVIWSRQAQRDTDMFDAVNFNTADGDALTDLVYRRYGKTRILDTRGSGTATLQRASGGIAETIWAGTRLLVVGADARTYRVSADTPAASTDLTVELPIEALDVGPGTAVNITDATGWRVRVNDVLEDSSWKVTSLTCGEGTLFERADELRARVRKERLAERVGHSQIIIDTCKTAGADNVAVFRSDYAGDEYDVGLNMVYVGNAGYVGSEDLVKACALALRSKRVAGAALQVRPMALASLAVTADVYLIGAPAKYNLTRLRSLHTSAITQYLNGTSGTFTYSRIGILSSIIRFSPEVQRVNVTAPSVDDAIVSGPARSFPGTLTRYVVSTVTLNYLPFA